MKKGQPNSSYARENKKGGGQEKPKEENTEEEKTDAEEHSDVPACVLCHFLLKIEAWNSQYDITYCDNLGCEWYHRPQGSIRVPIRSMSEVRSNL